MKKLVIDCLIYQKNKAFGYQEYLFNILKSFYENRSCLKYDEIIIICRKSDDSNFMQFSNKMRIRGFNINNKVMQLYVQNNLKYLLQLTKNDVVLYTYNYGPIFSQCKSILVIHDLLFFKKEYLPNRFMRLQRKFFVPISIKNAMKVIAISNSTKNDIQEKYKTNESKIKVVYNHFNFDKFMTFSRENVDVYPYRPYILSVSSLGKHKNIIILLKAFNELCKKNMNYKLIFVGSLSKMYNEHRQYYENLEKPIKDKIIFMESISNFMLGILYQQCSLFVLPTLFEGLGMPIVEALYFNAPTLVSDIGVCREVSLNSAMYFDPESAENLLQIIEKYKYNFPRPNVHENIVEIFSEEKTSLEYINIVNTI